MFTGSKSTAPGSSFVFNIIPVGRGRLTPYGAWGICRRRMQRCVRMSRTRVMSTIPTCRTGQPAIGAPTSRASGRSSLSRPRQHFSTRPKHSTKLDPTASPFTATGLTPRDRNGHGACCVAADATPSHDIGLPRKCTPSWYRGVDVGQRPTKVLRRSE